MNSDNPFSAPSKTIESHTSESSQMDDSLGVIAKRTFLAWEKLRLLYNAVLVVETIAIGLAAHPLLLQPEFWVSSVMGAVFANACFFLGPIIETYVAWLGHPSRTLRLVMFIVGTVVSCLLVIVALRFLIMQMSN
jgi:hypothetical protein